MEDGHDNLKAARGVITALRVSGRIKPEFESLAQHLETLAFAVDMSDSNASLHKEYGAAQVRLLELTSVSMEEDDTSSEHDNFINEVST